MRIIPFQRKWFYDSLSRQLNAFECDYQARFPHSWWVSTCSDTWATLLFRWGHYHLNPINPRSIITTYFQVYGPCILLVVISWVSFWLNREATSDRISLGPCIFVANSSYIRLNRFGQTWELYLWPCFLLKIDKHLEFFYVKSFINPSWSS